VPVKDDFVEGRYRLAGPASGPAIVRPGSLAIPASPIVNPVLVVTVEEDLVEIQRGWALCQGTATL
jgi:hypothetical protein